MTVVMSLAQCPQRKDSKITWRCFPKQHQTNSQAAGRAPSLYLSDTLKTREKLLHKSPSWQVDVLMLTLPSHLHTKIQQQVLVGECMCQISSTALLFRTGWQQSAWILAEWIMSSAQFYPGNKQVLNCNDRIHLFLEFNIAPLSWNSWLLL